MISLKYLKRDVLVSSFDICEEIKNMLNGPSDNRQLMLEACARTLRPYTKLEIPLEIYESPTESPTELSIKNEKMPSKPKSRKKKK
jgi:hypothetical protein